MFLTPLLRRAAVKPRISREHDFVLWAFAVAYPTAPLVFDPPPPPPWCPFARPAIVYSDGKIPVDMLQEEDIDTESIRTMLKNHVYTAPVSNKCS